MGCGCVATIGVDNKILVKVMATTVSSGDVRIRRFHASQKNTADRPDHHRPGWRLPCREQYESGRGNRHGHGRCDWPSELGLVVRGTTATRTERSFTQLIKSGRSLYDLSRRAAAIHTTILRPQCYRSA
jgi:hypothetical protein